MTGALSREVAVKSKSPAGEARAAAQFQDLAIMGELQKTRPSAQYGANDLASPGYSIGLAPS